MDSKRYTADCDPAAAPRTRFPDNARGTPALPHEDELADRFRERLRLFAARRLGDAATAEDVAQETLRRVVDAMRAGRITQPIAFPAFVFETARHVCQQHYRSAGREGRALHRVHGDSLAHGAFVSDPFSTLVSDDRAVRVRQALGSLRHDDRELLRLLYHEELETDEAASRLGLSPSTLRVRKHRALKRLGELLHDNEL